jgi:hypothetical protein
MLAPPATRPLSATDPVTRPPGRGDLTARLAGAGAIAFSAVVVLQNVIRGGAAPTNDASAADVLRYYADHRAVTFVLVGLFVLSGAALAAFLGGAMRRLVTGGRPAWAIAGAVGATGIMALFAVVVAAEQALSVAATRARPDLGAIDALWAFHNSAFSVLSLSLAIALVGLARAGVSAGITPRIFDRLAPPAAGLLALGAVAGPAIAAGDAMPIFALSTLGFVTWLAFLVTTGIRLLHIDPTDPA